MATWCQGVRAAASLIHNIEQCMRETCIPLREVTLYPFQSTGGRSKGVTACFESQDHKCVHISLYEHWNSDQIDIKFDRHLPSAMDKNHDVPDIQFRTDQVKHAAYAIQSFVVQALGMNYPDEWYVPFNEDFQGFGSVGKKVMDYVDDKMTPILVNWLPAPEDTPDKE